MAKVHFYPCSSRTPHRGDFVAPLTAVSFLWNILFYNTRTYCTHNNPPSDHYDRQADDVEPKRTARSIMYPFFYSHYTDWPYPTQGISGPHFCNSTGIHLWHQTFDPGFYRGLPDEQSDYTSTHPEPYRLCRGPVYLSQPFLTLAPILFLLFGTGFAILIWLIDRPLYRAFRIRGLEFLNAFIAHLTDGSRSMEDFFRRIGEEAFVPQVSIFFRREGKQDLIFTIPNVHPGPMGEIGGGNLPAILREQFDEEVMVAHGCATHDFNLVSESEIQKLVDAVNKTRNQLEYTGVACKSTRIIEGTVSLLYQRIGNALLMVSTRSPDKTEDLDFCIGHSILCEGHRMTPHIGFVDAHNCIGDEIASIRPGTKTAHEYFTAACHAFDQWEVMQTSVLSMGYAHIPLPYGRTSGIGDIGLQVLITDVSGQKTAYILLDGNNMASGAREEIRDEVLTMVDEAEIMTTDTHVVNTISGKNPVGMRVPPTALIPYIDDGVIKALEDLSPATAAGSTASCEGVVIFGSDSIAQLASIVNTILVYVIPISGGMLLMAVVLSVIAYMALS